MADDGHGAQFLPSGCAYNHIDVAEKLSAPPQAGRLDNAGPEGSSIDLRNRIARQWRCPAFAWKALEMPVRNLFRVTHASLEQKPAPDVAEAFAKKPGDAFLSAVEDGLSDRKLVTIVLAFQRWRHIQLKSILGQELRKVLDDAREDETALAALETELEHTEQQLATARTNSSRLRTQLAAKVTASHPENGFSADNPTGSKSGREMMKTMEGLKEAETEIQRRDHQIQQLNERLQCMQDQSGRFGGQLSRLQADKCTLQAENTSALRENRALLEQLSFRDNEVIKQVEEMERLKALAAKLVEQQNSKQQQMELIMAEHSAQVKTLQEQLQQACGAKCSKEVDLATTVEHCSHLKQEKDTLLLQLQEAERRADLASSRAQELCTKLQCTTDDRAKASEEVASEMVKHLKKLTDHVRELEATVNATDAQQSSSHADGFSARYRIEHPPGSKLGCAEADRRSTPEFDQVYYTFPQDPVLGLLNNNYPLCPTCKIGNAAQDQRHVSFSSVSGHNLFDRSPRHRFQGKVENWIAWKWRWAASTARAELLAIKLHGFNQKGSEDSHLERKQLKVQELMERLRTGTLTTCMENELNTMVAEHKLVPLILSAWRAFTRTSALERKAISRSALLDKMLEALPWWIRRVSDRRQLERSFFQWQVLTLSADQQTYPQLDMRSKLESQVMEEPPNYDEAQTTSKPAMKLLNQVTRFDQALLGQSDENDAVAAQRRPPETHAANGNQKRSLGGNGNKLSSGSQTRALQALQTTLQQEVTELQKILCQEAHPLQRNTTQSKSRPATAPATNSYAKEHHPDGKNVLKSVLGVCNNLALALTNVRGKLSPRVLADTVITCNRNERTKLNKGMSGTLPLKDTRRQSILEGQSPKSSPRRGSVSGRTVKSRNSQAVESWGTPPDQVNSYSRRPTNMAPAQERRERVTSQGGEEKYYRWSSSTTLVNFQKDQVKETSQNLQGSRPESALETGLQKLCSRYGSHPFRSHNNGTTTPRTKKASPGSRTDVVNTPRKDRCSTTASPLAPVQETRRFKRGALHDKRSPRGTNPALSMSVIKKLLEEGATNASPDEKTLIGSAFARLLSSKISKLRSGQVA